MFEMRSDSGEPLSRESHDPSWMRVSLPLAGESSKENDKRKIAALLRRDGGQASETFCKLNYLFRTVNGDTPFPEEELPCKDCPQSSLH